MLSQVEHVDGVCLHGSPQSAQPARTPHQDRSHSKLVSAPNPTPYRAGTVITVTEGIAPGSKVEAITPSLGYSEAAGGTSLTGRSITLTVGTPVAQITGTPQDEAIATFENRSCTDPGTLKICKIAGTPGTDGDRRSASM